MHSLPSRRRLPQPNFFRFKCYRLSPLPFSRPPPALPAPAPPLPGLLPAAHLPVLDALPPVSSDAPALARPLAPRAVRRQARRPPSARGQIRTPGTVRQARARLGGAVGRQGRRTITQSADRDSVSGVGAFTGKPCFPSALSRAIKIVSLCFDVKRRVECIPQSHLHTLTTIHGPSNCHLNRCYCKILSMRGEPTPNQHDQQSLCIKRDQFTLV